MRAHFREPGSVAELGGTDSYARRLRDYAGAGRDQVAWLIERLVADPGARDATITTFQPPTDTTYVPCISLIDALAPDGRLRLVTYAHGLDLGKKAYGNFVSSPRSSARSPPAPAWRPAGWSSTSRRRTSTSWSSRR